MLIYFSSKKVEKLCCNQKESLKKLGPIISIKLIKIVGLLKELKCLNEVVLIPSLRFHKLKGDRQNQYSITISKDSPYRLILIPIDIDTKQNKLNSKEFETIVKIEILEVSKHYD